MDFITGLGILAENYNRNESYRDICRVKEETSKANDLAKKRNDLLKEQNELLKKLAIEKCIDLRRDNKKTAEELGISIEEYKHIEFTKALEERRNKKAKELGISVEEYKKRNAQHTSNNSGCTPIIVSIILIIFGLVSLVI